MGVVLLAPACNTQGLTTVDERSRCPVHHRRASPARRLRMQASVPALFAGARLRACKRSDGRSDGYTLSVSVALSEALCRASRAGCVAAWICLNFSIDTRVYSSVVDRSS